MKAILLWSLLLLSFKGMAFTVLLFSAGILVVEYVNLMLLGVSLCDLIVSHVVFTLLLLPLSG